MTNEISTSELEILRKWLRKSENKNIFENYVRDAYLLNRSNNSINLSASYEKVWHKIQDQEKPVRKLFNKKSALSIAASAALLVGLGTFMYNQRPFVNNRPVVTNTIKIGTDKAILTLADGSEVALEKNKNYKNKNVSSNGQEIVYGQEANTEKRVQYNYLTIPRGGQFFVQLADGTKIWLNSESQLKYPVAFTDRESRNVELVYGEAYFEVSPSTAHKGTRFKVLNKMQNVEVLGTEFNIKAYKDEAAVYTTLVKGKVTISTANTKQYLVPNQQAELNLKNQNLDISKVEVSNEVSWKKGIFSFERKPLKDIMRVLSRWYDVDVIFENKALENAKFIGILGKDQSLESILTTIKATNIINNYTIDGKTIYIK